MIEFILPLTADHFQQTLISFLLLAYALFGIWLLGATFCSRILKFEEVRLADWAVFVLIGQLIFFGLNLVVSPLTFIIWRFTGIPLSYVLTNNLFVFIAGYLLFSQKRWQVSDVKSIREFSWEIFSFIPFVVAIVVMGRNLSLPGLDIKYHTFVVQNFTYQGYYSLLHPHSNILSSYSHFFNLMSVSWDALTLNMITGVVLKVMPFMQFWLSLVAVLAVFSNYIYNFSKQQRVLPSLILSFILLYVFDAVYPIWDLLGTARFSYFSVLAIPIVMQVIYPFHNYRSFYFFLITFFISPFLLMGFNPSLLITILPVSLVHLYVYLWHPVKVLPFKASFGIWTFAFLAVVVTVLLLSNGFFAVAIADLYPTAANFIMQYFGIITEKHAVISGLIDDHAFFVAGSAFSATNLDLFLVARDSLQTTLNNLFIDSTSQRILTARVISYFQYPFISQYDNNVVINFLFIFLFILFVHLIVLVRSGKKSGMHRLILRNSILLLGCYILVVFSSRFVIYLIISANSSLNSGLLSLLSGYSNFNLVSVTFFLLALFSIIIFLSILTRKEKHFSKVIRMIPLGRGYVFVFFLLSLFFILVFPPKHIRAAIEHSFFKENFTSLDLFDLRRLESLAKDIGPIALNSWATQIGNENWILNETWSSSYLRIPAAFYSRNGFGINFTHENLRQWSTDSGFRDHYAEKFGMKHMLIERPTAFFDEQWYMQANLWLTPIFDVLCYPPKFKQGKFAIFSLKLTNQPCM